MKKWLLVCLLSLGVNAQTVSEFRSSASVAPAAGDPLQRITLPFEVYRDAKPDLSDLRLFNAKGEALPISFAGTPEPTIETPPSTTLTAFPLYSPAPRVGDTGSGRVDVRVKTGRDGTIVSVYESGRPAPAQPQRAVAWLLDTTQLKTPTRYLIVDWNSGPGLEAARITVEASDDLKYWHAIAHSAPVLKVEYGGREIAQRKVDVSYAKAKYMRLSADRPEFVLKSVSAEAAPAKRPAPRSKLTVAGKPGAKAGEFVYDLGARLPIESVSLRFGEVNSVAPFAILTRDDPAKEQARAVTNATFYRLMRQGVELESPKVEIGRQPARYWVARLDPNSPPPGGGAPTLEVEWRPGQLVYVARGEGPYTLAFGNAEAKRVMLETNQLIPGYTRLEELTLMQGQVGPVASAEKREEWWRKVTGDTPPKKIVLWGVLLAAVAALAAMAFRLSRTSGPGTPPTPPG
jgi:hypothetical protein